MVSTTPFIQPAKQTTSTGERRRVGFELEFAGLEMSDVARLLADSLDGKVQPKTHAECIVDVPDIGEFVVELDWEFAKETAKERARQHAEAPVLSVAEKCRVFPIGKSCWMTVTSGR